VDAAQERGELPQVDAVFDDEPDDEAHTELASQLQEELDRAVTSAFSGPFLVATALALAALIPLALAVPERGLRRTTPVAVALVAALAVVIPYAAFGGTSYEPTPTADPCRTREWRDPGGLQAVLEQVALSALDGAACDLGVTREELVLALRDEESLEDFAQEHGIERAEAERAIENGIDRAVDDAREAGSLSGFAATLVARAVDSVPPWLLLDALEGLRGLPL
jgi:hypothetical protein